MQQLYVSSMRLNLEESKYEDEPICETTQSSEAVSEQKFEYENFVVSRLTYML